MTRTWFITGANRGLGRAFTDAALAHGDRVVACVREASALPAHDDLTVLTLDVRDRDAVRVAVTRAFDLAGTIDVVVNNAGYGLVGAVEELTEQQIRDQMDTNFYGALWVSQAAAPRLRAQGRGHIVQISSVGAVGSLPLFGLYNASKWALEGFSAALAEELRPFGVAVTIAQLGGFDTDWAKSSMRFATAEPAYADLRTAILGTPDYPARTTSPTDTATSGERPADEIAGDPASGESTPGDPATDSSTAYEPPADNPTADDSDVHAAQANTEGSAEPEPEWVEADPTVAAAALRELVDMPEPPLRRIIGPGAPQMVSMALDQRRLDYARDPEFTWPA
ncbi:SDR family NAD(P)-dependent oxidoreductase [Nocardia takedensis]|uniref:SDR family NAD(P)-dependent oxidoreductase n=1 Tax=Nocardia takedensis TaxID=259390 RepID=UPI00031A6A1F|nr:SDR family NAD(P)-dependent oxidoreductase [Nocardia takedensis]